MSTSFNAPPPDAPRHTAMEYWAILTPGLSYVLDCYPEEAAHYLLNLRRALGPHERLLGIYPTQEEAQARIWAALQRRARALRALSRHVPGAVPPRDGAA